MCQCWYISAPALGALQKCCGKEKSCTHQEPKNSIWGKKINGRYELNRAGILWQHKSLYWCGSPRLGGHSEGLMALFAPRTERLLGKLMQQLLLWTFLPIRAIPSAARALHPRVLLGISNLGPVLSLQLDFFIFFKQRTQRDATKMYPHRPSFFQPHKLVLSTYHPPGSDGCIEHWFVTPPGPHLRTLSCIFGSQRNTGSDTGAFIHFHRSKCCIWIKLRFGVLCWSMSVAADAFYSLLPDSGSRA